MSLVKPLMLICVTDQILCVIIQFYNKERLFFNFHWSSYSNHIGN